MKKIVSITTIILLFTVFSFGQNQVDALRYSQSFLSGTARSVSMGGAFGALGGNFAAISINPAGLGVYRTSVFSFTPSFTYNVNNSKLGDISNEDFKYGINMSNMSMVVSLKSKKNNGWVATNLGFGYNRTNDFNNNTIIKRDNSPNSLLDTWVADANNNNWNSFANELGSKADLIYLDTNTDIWNSDLTGSNYGQKQNRTISTDGSMGEYVFAMGANYNNIIFLGGSISLNTIDFHEQMNHTENEIPEDIDYLNSFTYRTTLDVSGNGASFKFGTIVKPVNWLRLGLSVSSPVFYSLSENYSSQLDAALDFNNDSPQKISGEYDYKLVTPFRANASMAFVLSKSAIFSVDYEFVDYTKSRLRNGGDGYDFSMENEGIQNVYSSTGNLRTGLEYRFGPISFRGGYSYYGSPYKTGQLNENSDNSVFSGGIGINNGNFFFDLAYSHMTNSQYYVMYQLDNSTAKINSNKNQLLASFGFRF